MNRNYRYAGWCCRVVLPGGAAGWCCRLGQDNIFSSGIHVKCGFITWREAAESNCFLEKHAPGAHTNSLRVQPGE